MFAKYKKQIKLTSSSFTCDHILFGENIRAEREK